VVVLCSLTLHWELSICLQPYSPLTSNVHVCISTGQTPMYHMSNIILHPESEACGASSSGCVASASKVHTSAKLLGRWGVGNVMSILENSRHHFSVMTRRAPAMRKQLSRRLVIGCVSSKGLSTLQQGLCSKYLHAGISQCKHSCLSRVQWVPSPCMTCTLFS
jgi:hypothetical protein